MDNPAPSTVAPELIPFVLPGFGVLSLEGRDAVAFVQAQTMNDVAALTDGQWHWNGWLTPKGRVIALFALLRLDAERVWLVVPDADAQFIADGLKRFVFRSKVRIEVRGELCATGRFDVPDSARGSRLAVLDNGDVELDLGTARSPRTLLLTTKQAASNVQAGHHWRTIDLTHGLPRLDASQAEQWTPQQLSLDRLNAYSVKKGCYPGQEIVARTHFLGKAKRGLVLLEGPLGLSPGADVADGERNVGTVVSATGSVALAVLPLERDTVAPLSTQGARLSPRPLLDGLGR